MHIILLAVVALLGAAGGLAVALHHYFGWKGLVVFPVLLVGLVWLGKIVVGRLIKRFFLSLFSMKAGVLRGASMNVHSIVPVAKPAEREREADGEDDGPPSSDFGAAGEDHHEHANDDEDDSDQDQEPEKPRVYYEIDVTITPRRGSCNSVWEPTELMLTSEPMKSLADLGDKEVGTTYDCLLWDGSAFVSDEIGKHPGEQRLKLTMEVTVGTRHGWLYYYQEQIGEIELPEWKPAADIGG